MLAKALSLRNRASPRNVGTPGRLIMCSPLTPIFSKRVQPPKELANIFGARARKADNIRGNLPVETEFTGNIYIRLHLSQFGLPSSYPAGPPLKNVGSTDHLVETLNQEHITSQNTVILKQPLCGIQISQVECICNFPPPGSGDMFQH
jgi:hypothetical protein